MKVVSQNSDTEIAATRARDEAEGALTELTANLLRVTRGAGRPYQIVAQCVGVIQAVREYHKVTGRGLADLGQRLGVEHRRHAEMLERWEKEELSPNPRRRQRVRHHRGEYCATQQMLRGALQMVASRLLAQIPQEGAGERELWSGFRALEAVRLEMRRVEAQISSAERRADTEELLADLRAPKRKGVAAALPAAAHPAAAVGEPPQEERTPGDRGLKRAAADRARAAAEADRVERARRKKLTPTQRVAERRERATKARPAQRRLGASL